MTRSDFDFEDLVGEELDFYGVDGNCFKLDDTVYEAIEDDGADYYSQLGNVIIVESPRPSFGLPLARVVIEHEEPDIYQFIDLHDDHCWLSFGTRYALDIDCSRSYDTVFYFDYTPKDIDHV